MITNKLLFLSMLSFAYASPVPSSSSKEIDSRVLYDQRQEGEWNVRADLKNFVILIIPTQTSTPATAGAPALLDFLSKSLPRKSNFKRFKTKKQAASNKKPPTKIEDSENQETKHFIESKTAPYHVDISRNKDHLTQLPDSTNNREILITNPPSVSIVKSTDLLENIRNGRTLVLTVPADEEFVVTKTEDLKKIVKKDGKKKPVKENKEPIILLGAENEQCGPDLIRDSQGICRKIKK